MEPSFDHNTIGPLSLDTLRQRWKLILGLFVLGGALGVLVTFQREVPYEATSSIIVRVPGSVTLFNTLDDITEPERYVNDQAAILASTPVAIGALEILDETVPGHTYDLDDIRNSSTISAGSRSDVIQVRFKDPERDRAVSVVNALVASYGEISDAQSTYDEALTELDASIAATTAEIDAIQTRIDGEDLTPAELDLLRDRRTQAVGRESALLARRDQLLVDAELEASTIRWVSAGVAVQTVGSRWLLGLVAGLIFGAALGISLAYWLTPYRRRVWGPDQPEPVLRAPLLAEIPRFDTPFFPSSRRASLASDRIWGLSRLLQPPVDGADVTHRERIIAFLSAHPEDSRTLIAKNVAAAVAQAGSPVLLISTQSRGRGLVQVMEREGIEVEEQDLIDAMEDPSSALRSVQTGPVVGAPLLDTLVCREHDRSPRDLFASTRFGQVLDELVPSYALVIIDVPAVLDEPYAVDVLRRAGRSIAVVAHNDTTRSLRELRHHLDVNGLILDSYVYTGVKARTPLGLGQTSQSSPLDPRSWGRRTEEQQPDEHPTPARS